jgi:LPS-assembly lipoprotein
MNAALSSRRAVIAASAVALLTGCGFKARQAPQLPFRTLALSGFKPTSAMAEALRVILRNETSVRVLETAAQAEVVLEALADSHEKVVMASTATAQVREMQLRARLRFTLHTPAGKVLIAPSDIALSRDMSYNENIALAKGLEEQALYLAMHQDMARQVLHRLATVPSL